MFPRQYMTAAAVCPFAAGELPLGHYNATLALSFLQEFADATLLFDNTLLLRQLTSAAATQSHAAAHSSKSPARFHMSDLDNYVGRGLAGLAFPTDGPDGRRPFDPGDLVSAVCPMPSLKFLTLATAPAPLPPSGIGGSSVGGSSSSSGLGSGAGRPPPWDTLVGEVVSRTRCGPCRARSRQAAALGYTNSLRRHLGGGRVAGRWVLPLASTSHTASARPPATRTPFVSRRSLKTLFTKVGVLHLCSIVESDSPTV